MCGMNEGKYRGDDAVVSSYTIASKLFVLINEHMVFVVWFGDWGLVSKSEDNMWFPCDM